MSYSKTITVTESDFLRLKEGLHICINGCSRFTNIKVIKENSEDFLIATVTQVGGIFTYSCAIRVI